MRVSDDDSLLSAKIDLFYTAFFSIFYNLSTTNMRVWFVLIRGGDNYGRLNYCNCDAVFVQFSLKINKYTKRFVFRFSSPFIFCFILWTNFIVVKKRQIIFKYAATTGSVLWREWHFGAVHDHDLVKQNLIFTQFCSSLASNPAPQR